MQPPILPPDQRIATVTTRILADYGFSLSKTHSILDFGCGSGRHVLEFRGTGFNAFGYDTANSVNPVPSAELPFFRFSNDDRRPRIPWNDAAFDLVYSASVFEHVVDYDSTLSEISRVLKPGGVSLNYFPSRYRPIEPHMCVPFAGVFQRHKYFLFWAALGIRNRFQRGKPWREVARLNFDYSRSCLCYFRKDKIAAVAQRQFSRVDFVEDSYLRHAPGRSRYLYPIVQLLPGLKHVYSALHTRVLLLRK